MNAIDHYRSNLHVPIKLQTILDTHHHCDFWSVFKLKFVVQKLSFIYPTNDLQTSVYVLYLEIIETYIYYDFKVTIHKVIDKWKVSTHLLSNSLCSNYKRCFDRNKNEGEILMVWKSPLQAEVLLPVLKEPNEVYVYNKFYYKSVNYLKAFTLFLYF